MAPSDLWYMQYIIIWWTSAFVVKGYEKESPQNVGGR